MVLFHQGHWRSSAYLSPRSRTLTRWWSKRVNLLSTRLSSTPRKTTSWPGQTPMPRWARKLRTRTISTSKALVSWFLPKSRIRVIQCSLTSYSLSTETRCETYRSLARLPKRLTGWFTTEPSRNLWIAPSPRRRFPLIRRIQPNRSSQSLVTKTRVNWSLASPWVGAGLSFSHQFR